MTARERFGIQNNNWTEGNKKWIEARVGLQKEKKDYEGKYVRKSQKEKIQMFVDGKKEK